MLGLVLVLAVSSRVSAQAWPYAPAYSAPATGGSTILQSSVMADDQRLVAESAPAAPLISEDGTAGAGMWYEDEPSHAAPPCTPPRTRGASHLSSWLHGEHGAKPDDCLPPADYARPPFVDHDTDMPDQVPPGGRVYGSADALLWWLRRGGTPVLATTGTEVNPLAGPLVKDNNFDNLERYGVRATVGWWLNHDQTVAFEVSGLYLFQRNPHATLISGGEQPLARPFFDAASGLTGADILAFPGNQAGAFVVRDHTRLWGAEANFRHEALRCCYYHVDLLLGFRFLQFDEGMEINDETTFLPATRFAGTSVASSDRFGTRNDFYGGQLGAETEFHLGRWDLDLWGKVALGEDFQVLNINGTTVVLNPDGTTTGIANGLYAQPTNIGHHTRSEFAVLPEFGINLGFEITPHVRATFGYTFLYLSRVVRPGDQIDQTVTPALGAAAAAAAGATRPALLFRESDFWAQGLNLGLEFRY
jgi:Putative beta barrel porin-7 (BBP7)